MNNNATITVYLQALGGKFLGPNAYNTNSIQLTLQYSGGSIALPYQLVPGVTDDGIISQGFTDGSSSFMPILSMPPLSGSNPDVFYLTPGTNTIAGTAAFALPATAETATLTASIPSPSGNALLLSQPVLLSPQQAAYRIVMVVPGLLLRPNTSVALPGTISVFVTMMCGCKVTTGLPVSYWPPADFSVTALVQYTNNTVTVYTLSLYPESNNSLFSATVQDAENIQSVSFSALQKSTGNFGLLVQTL